MNKTKRQAFAFIMVLLLAFSCVSYAATPETILVAIPDSTSMTCEAALAQLREQLPADSSAAFYDGNSRLESDALACTGLVLQWETNGQPTQAMLAVRGDLNGTGVVGLSQLVVCARLLNAEDKPALQSTAADMNADGMLNLTDLVLLAALVRPAPEPTPDPTPEPTPDPTPLPLTGITIGLDPGHQARGNYEKEPVAPGSSETKAKVSSGTAGVVTGIDEYAVNLDVGLKLRYLLESQGATVVMSRETNEVDISNAQRAIMMNEAGCDLVVRLHCDGEDNPARHGAFILIPVGWYARDFEAASREAAQYVLDAFVAATAAKNLGLSERDDQTGFNWSTVPVINIEMGHMSNAEEDRKLASDNYRWLCAQGIANGIQNYFS